MGRKRRNRRMFRLLTILIVIAALVFIISGQSQKAKVVRIIDGDTIRIFVNGQYETVRLIGVDTPEEGECFSEEAAESLKPILNKEVELESDSSQSDRDRYRRLLRYVHWSGNNMNQWLIENGFAKEYTYSKPYKYQKEFRSAEIKAKNLPVSLWKCPVDKSTSQNQ